MANLNNHVKRFIVQHLACYDTPTEVAKAVNEEFEIEITRQQAAKYDPDKHAGKDLSKPLVTLFRETREKFRASTEDIPIANKSFRMRELQKLAVEAKRQGNKVLAASLLEQASKESGDYWTNRREFSGPGGDPLPPMPVVIRFGAEGEDGD